MQAVADPQCQFLNLFVGYQGSMIPELFQMVDIPLWHGQSHSTPYREPVRSTVAARFHMHQPKVCSMTEMAFDIMKTKRQSIFSRLWKCTLLSAVKVMAGCAISHNFCLRWSTLGPFK
jgi:hypothetical protein